MKNLTVARMMFLIISAPCICNAATTVTYDFESGLNGWTNLTSPTSGPPAFVSSTSGLLGGNATAGLVVDVGSRDSSGDLPLWATSPIFSMPSSLDNEISFTLWGGDQDTPIPNTADASLSSTTANNAGFQGIALRRVSDGAFILSGGRSSNGQTSGQTTTWDAATINAAISGDAASETYSLDFIDTAHGSWGWVAADNIVVTTADIIAIPEPSVSVLLGLAGLVLLRRRR